MKIRKVILSRGRAESITTHRRIPDATLVVTVSEAEQYAHTKLPIVTIPDQVVGLSNVRNWILDKFDEEVLVMFDDDMRGCYSLVWKSWRRLSDEETAAVIENTARCAMEAGVHLFGWSQNVDVRKFMACDPFSLVGYVGWAIGVIGRKHRFDPKVGFKDDLDFAMQHLKDDRIIWRDERFGFLMKRDTNSGGNAIYRTRDKIEAEKAYLKRKWGRYVDFGQYKTQEKSRILVSRKQSIST